MTEDGARVVYLDHAATSRPKPPVVVEAMTAALTDLGSPGRGAHRLAVATTRVVSEARSAVAGLLGVTDPRDLTFQYGCTHALNVLLQGTLAAGDRVVVSSMEHNAVVRPLHALSERGVEIAIVDADEAGVVDAEAVEREVRARRTRAVVCQHVSNVTGAVQPVADLVDIAHEADALIIVDGAQAAGHLDVDLGRLGVDGYAVSGHKGLLGPQGVGVMFVAPGVEVRPLVLGGTGSASESPEQPTQGTARFEAGTPGVPAIAGLGAAARWLATEAAGIREREGRLTRVLLEGLGEIPDVRVLGPGPDAPRGPIVALVSGRYEPDRLAHELDSRWGIAARAGLHCAPWAHRSIGTLQTGALRLGLGWDTSDEDVATALEALAELHV